MRSKLVFTDLVKVKSFLCWDKFPELTIQLIPIQNAVGFFVPPRQDCASIYLFYQEDAKDLSAAVFLLFHEVGHYQQYCHFLSHNQVEYFEQKLASNMPERVAFEKESWDLGEALLKEFLQDQDDEAETVRAYQSFARVSINTYGE